MVILGHTSRVWIYKMKRVTAHLRGAFYITRQANHTLVHIALGISWFYFLRRSQPEMTSYHMVLSLLGSCLPDFEHLIYFYIHGRKDQYSKDVKKLLYNRQWRALTLFIKNNHKQLTSLRLHSLPWVIILVLLTITFFIRDQISMVTFLGAMITHYIFDIVDDIIFLRKLNSNWTRGLVRRRNK